MEAERWTDSRANRRYARVDGTVLTKEDLEGSWADIARRREREGSDEAE